MVGRDAGCVRWLRRRGMSQFDENFRREDLQRGMREVFDQTLKERVERYLEVAHQGIIPNHHFAAASSECIDLYRDGYSLSAVMVSQAVTEGIWRFVRSEERRVGKECRS